MYKEPKFNFVVAHPWDEDDPDNLCIYAFGGEVRRGTLEDAQGFLDYVRSSSGTEQYKIYRVKYEVIEDV